MPFRERDFAFRELFSELRKLLREYPGTLPELREWLFTPRAFFLKLGGPQASDLRIVFQGTSGSKRLNSVIISATTVNSTVHLANEAFCSKIASPLRMSRRTQTPHYFARWRLTELVSEFSALSGNKKANTNENMDWAECWVSWSLFCPLSFSPSQSFLSFFLFFCFLSLSLSRSLSPPLRSCVVLLLRIPGWPWFGSVTV